MVSLAPQWESVTLKLPVEGVRPGEGSWPSVSLLSRDKEEGVVSAGKLSVKAR